MLQNVRIIRNAAASKLNIAEVKSNTTGKFAITDNPALLISIV
jgi:hypothetical protein